MTDERYFFFDKRYLGDTWERSISAGTQGHSLLWCNGVRFVCTNLVQINLTPMHQSRLR